MEKIKCRLCESNNLVEYNVIDNYHTIYKCNTCEFVQLPTISINELDDVANEESINQDKYRKTSKKDMEINSNVDFPDIMVNLAHVIQQDTKRIRAVVEKLAESYNNIKFIDIGSGYGHIGFGIGNNNSNIDVHYKTL